MGILANVKLARISSSFEFALPPCISVEGAHTDDELKTCTAPGLIKHVSGVRGVRATLVQQSIEVIDNGGAVDIGGVLDVNFLKLPN